MALLLYGYATGTFSSRALERPIRASSIVNTRWGTTADHSGAPLAPPVKPSYSALAAPRNPPWPKVTEAWERARDFMKPMGMSARQLASDIDVLPSSISELRAKLSPRIRVFQPVAG